MSRLWGHGMYNSLCFAGLHRASWLTDVVLYLKTVFFSMPQPYHPDPHPFLSNQGYQTGFGSTVTLLIMNEL